VNRFRCGHGGQIASAAPGRNLHLWLLCGTLAWRDLWEGK
jgi:hypothetical protein